MEDRHNADRPIANVLSSGELDPVRRPATTLEKIGGAILTTALIGLVYWLVFGV